jgi:hypothetical protein
MNAWPSQPFITGQASDVPVLPSLGVRAVARLGLSASVHLPSLLA